jgi:hypothetical protein
MKLHFAALMLASASAPTESFSYLNTLSQTKAPSAEVASRVTTGYEVTLSQPQPAFVNTVTGVAVNRDAEAIIRSQYSNWLQKFGKLPDESRYVAFRNNFIAVEEYGVKYGKFYMLNEFADCTEQEFYRKKQGVAMQPQSGAKPQQVSNVQINDPTYVEQAPVKLPSGLPSTASPNAPASSGMVSYLEALRSSNSVSGPGLTSYLEALPKSFDESVTSTQSVPGQASSIASAPMTDSMASSSYSAASASIAAVAKTTGAYMDALSSTGAAAPSGKGITTYLDALRTSNSARGPGMTSYLDVVNVAASPARSAPPAPAQKVAASSAAYLASMSASTSAVPSSPPSSGLASYLDTMKRTPSTSGPGMGSYLSNVGAAGSLDLSSAYKATPVANTEPIKILPESSRPIPSASSTVFAPTQVGTPPATTQLTAEEPSEVLKQEFSDFLSQPRTLTPPPSDLSKSDAKQVSANSAEEGNSGAFWSIVAATFVGAAALQAGAGNGVYNLDAQNLLQPFLSQVSSLSQSIEASIPEAPKLFFAEEMSEDLFFGDKVDADQLKSETALN